jgi:hypothetical protein
MIAGVIFGIIIVIAGLGLFLQQTGVIGNFWNVLWPIIIVIFGTLILLGAIYGQRKRNEIRR